MDFECSVSPVPSPPPSLQLETTAEMRCQQTWAKCGSSTNGAVATAKVVEGTGLLGEALDDADFGFSHKLSHEAATSSTQSSPVHCLVMTHFLMMWGRG